MPTFKQKKPSRLSVSRKGPAFTVVIEGSPALLMTSIIAALYVVHLFL